MHPKEQQKDKNIYNFNNKTANSTVDTYSRYNRI